MRAKPAELSPPKMEENILKFYQIINEMILCFSSRVKFYKNHSDFPSIDWANWLILANMA